MKQKVYFLIKIHFSDCKKFSNFFNVLAIISRNNDINHSSRSKKSSEKSVQLFVLSTYKVCKMGCLKMNYHLTE